MKQEHIKAIFESYFVMTGCEIFHSDCTCIQVKLSPIADRTIANRPYYWAFVDNMHQEPEPLSYTFWFAPQQTDLALPLTQTISELITIGNDKLNVIMQELHTQGSYTMLFEKSATPRNIDSYDSWLNVNYMLHFQTYSNRNDVHSIGISLTTGEIVEDFMEQIAHMEFSSTIATAMMIKPVLSMESAQQLIKSHIHNQLTSANHAWAIRASELEINEHNRLKSYYMERNEPELLTKRTTEISKIYAPTLSVEIINCGIFHFLNHFRHKNSKALGS
jgi:hypothetical protein